MVIFFFHAEENIEILGSKFTPKICMQLLVGGE